MFSPETKQNTEHPAEYLYKPLTQPVQYLYKHLDLMSIWCHLRAYFSLGLFVLACSTQTAYADKPQELRVISLSPSNTELVHALGAQENLVGRTSSCNFPKEAEQITDVGSLFPPDYERIASLNPTLILMSDGNVSVRDHLQHLGFRVLVIHPKSVADVVDSILSIGRTLGRSTEAKRLSTDFKKRLEQVRQIGRSGLKTFYEVWHKPFMIPGHKTFLADLLRRAGAQPIGQSMSGDWPTVEREWLIIQQPEVILVKSKARQQFYLNSRIWQHTPAVKKAQVYVIPNEDEFLRPTPRLINALVWLQEKLTAHSK